MIDDVWTQITELSHGYVTLHADIKPGYEFECTILPHDRLDSSDYVFRSQESRSNWKGKVIKLEYQADTRPKGSICIANEEYLRYMGELEVARIDMPGERRINVIGQVVKEDLKYLPYINIDKRQCGNRTIALFHVSTCTFPFAELLNFPINM